MKNKIFIFIFSLFLFSCDKQEADLIVFNANTYTVNEFFDVAEAFAVKDGKFVAIGTNDEIQNR